MAHRVREAAWRNDVEALSQLLDEDPGLVEAHEEGYRRGPLYDACMDGSLEAAALLLDRGAGVNRRGHYGKTPLMVACQGGHVGVVSLLLARGADSLLRDDDRSTALTHAAMGTGGRRGSDHVAVLRLLLKDGRVRDRNLKKALYEACLYNHAEGVRVLLVEGGADHTVAIHGQKTPMAVAQELGGRHACIQVMKVLRGQPLTQLALDYHQPL